MTREEKLYSMTMVNLVEVANKLGIKIDKKGAKSKAVAKILEAEAKAEAVKVEEPKRLQEVRKQRNEAENSLLKAKGEVFSDILDDDYVAEVMEQKKELGIECPPIESVEIVSDECAGDGTPLVEVGKEIAEQAKEKAKKAKKVVEKFDVLAITEELAKKFKADYKCSRDGIGIFVDDKRVLDFWKRTNKVRVYISDADVKFNEIAKSSFILNLSDNPSKSARLNKSFYVAIADVEKLFSSYFAKKN